jgi:CheY-like chemotaxis protein/tRNA A-37 threonylcarbamoyl transferase component Bud32
LAKTNVDAQLLFEECSELLSGLQADLLGVRDRKPGQETRARMQRSAHTAKGLVGFLGIQEMDKLALGIADVLKRFRDDESVAPMPETVDRIASEVEELGALLARLGGALSEDVPEIPDSSSAGTTGPAAADTMKALSDAAVEVLGGFGFGDVSCSEGPIAEGVLKTSTDMTVAANLNGNDRAAVVLALDSDVAHRLTSRMAAFMYGEDHVVAESEEEELVHGALGEMVNYIALAMLSKLGLPPEVGSPCFVCGKGRELASVRSSMLEAEVHTEFGDFIIGFLPGTHVCDRANRNDTGSQSAPLSKGKVVIADDSLVMRKTIERILDQAGFTVVAHATNGQEAVEQFRRHRPDLVTMDINMPVMSGLDALRIIRAEDPTARVLMCSAIAENGIIRRGLSSGAVGYITKPFKPETVLDAVKYLVSQTAKKKTERRGGAAHPDALGIYRVDEVLGEGGMAVVYSGYDPGLGRKVAIKVMMDKYAADVDLVVRFLEEARAVARVSHSNVVSVYAAGSDGGKHYFAMEFLPGPDLEEFVYRTGPLAPDDALAYVRQGAMGLSAAAEKGLIHCDVKPSNLVFGADGKVKVTDFGIAQKAGTEEVPTISEMVGTPSFMSPEQVQELAIDHRADIYSLGTTLYYLLTGDPPYDGDDGVAVALRQVHDPVPQVPGAPRKLNKLLATMMAKSPDARFATYAELIAGIDRLL